MGTGTCPNGTVAHAFTLPPTGSAGPSDSDCNRCRNQRSLRGCLLSGTEYSGVRNSSAAGPSGMSVPEPDRLEVSSMWNDNQFCSHRSRSGPSGMAREPVWSTSDSCSGRHCSSVVRDCRIHRAINADQATGIRDFLYGRVLFAHRHSCLADSICHSVTSDAALPADVGGAA